MGNYTITLLPGDGIGPEITKAMTRVVDAACALDDIAITWESIEVGGAVIDRCGSPMPPEAIESIRKNKVAIKGPITTPVGKGFRSANVALRQELDLYVNLRPVFSMPGSGGRYDDVDLVIVRENTEDLYAGIEFEQGSADVAELIDFVAEKTGKAIRPDSALSIKPISFTASERIVRWAFDYALANNRAKVCAVHKANIQKFSDGLFLHTAEAVAKDYEGRVAFEDRIVDACCMGLVTNPSAFDVLVLPNLYGDIVSDLCAGLVGGLGLAAGANIGAECAVFEAVHGSAPDIAGKGVANPTALIMSAVLMLKHLGEIRVAARIEAAVRKVLAEGACVTADIKKGLGLTGAAASTEEYADAVIAALA